MKNKNTTIIDFIQGTEEWLNNRKMKITGTLISKLNTQSGYKQYMGLDVFAGNYHTERGNNAEPLIREIVNEQTNLDFNEIVVEQDNMQGSLDGLSKNCESILEIKCPENTSSVIYEQAKKGIIPKAHKLQMQFYMMLTGASIGYYVVAVLDDTLFNIDKNTMITVKLKSDVKEQEEIKANINKFLKDIENGEYDSKELPQGFELLAEEYKGLKTKQSDIEKQLKPLEQSIKDYGKIKACGINVSVVESERKTVNWENVITELADCIDKETLNKIVQNNTTVKKTTVKRLTTYGN